MNIGGSISQVTGVRGAQRFRLPESSILIRQPWLQYRNVALEDELNSNLADSRVAGARHKAET